MIKKTLLLILLSISANASETWTVKFAYDDGLIQNIFFIDETTGWACANLPGVLKTEDGGNTWEKIYFGGNGRIDAIWFVTKNKGWAVGAHVIGGNYGDSGIRVLPVIYATNDGGRSWNIQKIVENSGAFSSLYFTDDKHGLAAGGVGGLPSGILYYTSDGGENWIEIDSPGSKQYNGFDYKKFIHDLYFIDPQLGWAMVNVVVATNIFHTSDGGKSWILQSTIDKGTSLSKMHFVDSMNGWVIGGRHSDPTSLLRTTDGGNTWKKVLLAHDENDDLWLADVLFIDKMHGWICGNNGTVFSTHDGGDSWIKESVLTEEFLVIIAATKSKIFIVGQNGNIYSKPLTRKIK